MEQHYFWLGVIVGLFFTVIFFATLGAYGTGVCKETLKASDCHLEWVAGAGANK